MVVGQAVGTAATTALAVIGAVFAEWVGSSGGLGYLIQAASQDFDTTTVFAGLLALTLLIVAVNALVEAAERRLLRWRPADVQSERRLVTAA